MTGKMLGRELTVWIVFIAAESVHGALRRLFLEPAIGDLHAHQAGVAIGSLIVFLVTWAFGRWLRLSSARAALVVGGRWVALTVVFEVALGLAQGYGPAQITADYDPSRGGVMLLGLVVMWLTPLAVWRINRRPPQGGASA